MCKRVESKNKKFFQKGSTLLFAVLVSTIVLTAGLTISEIIVREIQNSADLDNNRNASSAAISGIETGLLLLKGDITTRTASPVAGTLSNGATYTYNIYDQSGNIVVEGIGLSRKVRRKFKATMINAQIDNVYWEIVE